MRDFELFIPFEKTVNDDGSLKLFGGIASSTSVDKDNERMDKAVLNKIASDLKKNSTVFFNHDLKGLGVGTVASAEVVNDSVRISVVPTKAEGMRDVVTQIQEGVLKSFSIGGKIRDWEDQFDEKLNKKVRVIKDVDCYEVSVVGIPANSDASILSYMSKSFKGDDVEPKVEKAVSAPAILANEKKESEVGQGENAKHEAGETYASELKEHHVKCAFGKEAMLKCAKCGADNKFVPESEVGPGEIKGVDDILASDGFKKVFTDFEKSYVARFDEMQKSFEIQKTELQESLKSRDARIEELHKALDKKAEKTGVVSKALASSQDEMQTTDKFEKTADTEAKNEGSFALFPKGTVR
jgi:HK97 family phage prohead protease